MTHLPIEISFARWLSMRFLLGLAFRRLRSLCRSISAFPPGNFRMRWHIRRQQMKLLHLRSPRHHLRPVENTRIVHRPNFDEHPARRALRARRKIHSAPPAEMSRRPPWMPFIREHLWRPLRKLETFCLNRHVKISSASRNLLARPAITKPSKKLRPLPFVTNFPAVTTASEAKLSRIHTN
jgi:hypothetical protein